MGLALRWAGEPAALSLRSRAGGVSCPAHSSRSDVSDGSGGERERRVNRRGGGEGERGGGEGGERAPIPPVPARVINRELLSLEGCGGQSPLPPLGPVPPIDTGETYPTGLPTPSGPPLPLADPRAEPPASKGAHSEKVGLRPTTEKAPNDRAGGAGRTSLSQVNPAGAMTRREATRACRSSPPPKVRLNGIAQETPRPHEPRNERNEARPRPTSASPSVGTRLASKPQARASLR